MNSVNIISHRLIEGLRRLQSTNLDLPLVPLNGNKQPLGDRWQERPSSSAELIEAIAHGGVVVPIKGETKKIQLQGIGLLTGCPININGQIYYLMAIDQDGKSAALKIQELGGSEFLPKTVAFTSGRVGRCQYLFLVPEEYKDAIRTKKVKTGVKGDDGSSEQVEFRWSNLQSVLPPSVHPTTGEYRWVEGCAIDEIEIALAPIWVIEQMLIEPTPGTTPLFETMPATTSQSPGRNNFQKTWTNIDFAKSYLNAPSSYRASDYDDWLTVGMALHSVDDSLLVDWDTWSQQSSKYKPGGCEKKWNSFSSNGGVTLGTLAHLAKHDGWQFPPSNGNERASLNNQHSQQRNDTTIPPSKKTTVTRDSSPNNDTSNLDRLDIPTTVTTVTKILQAGLSDYVERDRLDQLQNRSLLSKAAFWQLVAAIRCSVDEVSPEDTDKFNQLIDWYDATLDLQQVLPSPIANAFNHDAEILNIDPVSLWQYFLPAVLSLSGKKINLDVESHLIPTILWTCLVSESGTGKSRAEGVILAPLKKLQYQEKHRWKQELLEYKQTLKANSKDAPELEAPRPERKYLFEIATIQAVMRRLSEQGQNGSLWARDEIAGLFKSLGQFARSGNDSEGLECLLKMWDGSGSFVDRIDAEENSYAVEQNRLNIAGGIQPGAFCQVFKDPNDAQGLQARFLYAVPKIKRAKRVKGYCQLSDLLPSLYQWLDELPSLTVRLSRDADKRYTDLVEKIGIQTEAERSPTIKAWMRKLPTQLLRIALGLHLVECYYERRRPLWELHLDTLERAFTVCRYYRSAFAVVQEKVADSDNTSSILLKIWDMAVTQPEGVTPRDIYRTIKAIGRRAATVGRHLSAYTLELLSKLVEMGKGTLEKNGRSYRFKAHLNSFSNPTGTSEQDKGEKQQEMPLEIESGISWKNSNFCVAAPKKVTVETVVQSQTGERLESSLNLALSPVTIQNEADLNWLIQFLNDLEREVTPHPRWNNNDELEISLTEAEEKASVCREQLEKVCPHYWFRVGNALATTIERLALLSEPASNETQEPLKDSQPTLASLQALLLACKSLSELKALKQKHREQVGEAYRQLPTEQQLIIDGISATSVEHEVFKYLGGLLEKDGQRLTPGALVYLDPHTHNRPSLSRVSVWSLKGVKSGWSKALEISRDCLRAVEKAISPGGQIVEGEQGMLFDL